MMSEQLNISTPTSTYNSDKFYSLSYRQLHWALAAIVMVLLLAGQQFNFDISSDYRTHGLKFHSTLGSISLVIVLTFICKRFIFCARTPKPKLPIFKIVMAKSVQFGLYVAALMIPLSGLIATFYSSTPVYLLGMFNIAILTDNQVANFSYFRGLHTLAIYGVMLLLSAHAGAALYHHFVKKDAVLKSMIGINPRLNKLLQKLLDKMRRTVISTKNIEPE